MRQYLHVSSVDKAQSDAMFTFQRIFIIVHLCLFLSLYTYSASQKRKSYIITPQRIDVTNKMDDQHARSKLPKLHYKINLEGKQYMLDLQLNKNLHTDAARIERHVASDFHHLPSKRKYPKQCHFTGSVRGYPRSKLALTNCDGLMGYILIDDEVYMIEPLRNISSVTDHEHPHLMYTEQKNGKRLATCTNRGHKSKYARRRRKTNKNHHHHQHQHIKENKLFENQGHIKKMYMEVTLMLDKTLLDFHTAIDVDAYMVTIMNIANAAMADSSFGAPIELGLVRIVKLEQEDDEMNIAMSPDSEKVLELFQAWQMRFNPTSDEHPDHHDMAILVTRVDICLPGHPENCGLVGLTQLATLCDPLQSAMLAEDDGLTLGFTIAHELGHTMGMFHDSEEESGCNPAPYDDGYVVVMADNINLKMRGWSNCSRESLWAWLDTGQDFCLYDLPQSERFSLSSTLPGATYSLHHQCRFYFGMDATECPDEGIECTNMKCMINNNCIHTSTILADGTECSPHHWCFRGECINEGMMPKSHDGQWSEWGPWSACSRTCGGGVTRSIRHCDNPPPLEGGRYCTGQRVKHDLCNTASCPYGVPSFRDVQCTEFNSVPWITNETHLWKSVATTAENPCELLCQNEENQRAVLKSQVTDGTPCYLGENHICVHGVCQNVPCDMKVGSTAVEDACGVCHGDGDTCSLQSSEMHFTAKATYQQVVVVPLNTIFATIEEMFPTTSNFLAKVGSDIVLKGRKFGVTMVGNTRIWMGEIRHQQEILKIRGPFTKELKIMIAARDEVSVKYTLGTPYHAKQVKPVYIWDYIDWGECSVPCGPGTQIQVAKCVEDKTGLVEDKYCALVEKPPPNSRLCEMRVCEPRWQIGEWSGCDCECEYPSSVEEERAVDCVRRVGDEEETIVADALCEPPKPTSVRECVCPPKDELHKPKGHHKEKNHHHKKRQWRNKFVRYNELVRRQKRKHHDGVLSRSHIQNIHAIEEIRGALFVDYHDLDKLNFALEVNNDVRQHPVKGFPKPKSNDNLIHIKGKQAVKFLQNIQDQGHKNTNK